MADDPRSTIRVDAETKPAQDEIKSLRGSFGALKSDVTAIGSLGAQSFQTFFSSISQGGASVRTLRQDIASLAALGTQSFRTFFSSVTQGGASFAGLKQTVAGFSTSVRGYFSNLGDAFKLVSTDGSGLSGVISNLAGAIPKLGVAAYGVGAAVVGVGAALAGVGTFVLGAVTGVAALTKSYADQGDQFLKLSRQTGVGVEALSTYKYIGDQAGLSVETLANATFKMGVNVATGGKKVEQAFKAIGTSSKELRDLSPEDQFAKINAGLAGIPNEGQRAAVGMAIFGKQFKDISVLAAEDIGALTLRAKELGLTMSEDMAIAGDQLGDTLNDMSGMFQGLRNVIGAYVLPIANAFIGTIRDEMLVVFGMLRTAFGPVLAGFVGFKDNAIEASKSADFHTTVLKALVSIIAFLIDAFAGVIKAAAAVVDTYYTLRVAGNTLLISFGLVVAGVLDGARQILNAFAKITLGEVSASYTRGSQAISEKLKVVASDTKRLSEETGVLRDRGIAISGTMKSFADTLETASTNLRKQSEGYKGVASAVDQARPKVAKFDDDLMDSTEKLIGTAKKVDTFKTSLKELGEELDLARAHGLSTKEMVEQYGAKVLEAGQQAKVFGITVVGVTKEIYDAAVKQKWSDVWIMMGNQVREHFLKWNDDVVKANQKTADAINKTIESALGQYVTFSEKNTEAALHGTDLRLAAIEKERKAELAKIEGVGPLYARARAEVNKYYDDQKNVAIGTFDTIEQRMRSMGVETRSDLKKSADDAKRDYLQMKESGLYTADQIYQAWKRMQEANKKLNGDWLGSTVGMLDKMAASFETMANIAGGALGRIAGGIGNLVGSAKTGLEGLSSLKDGIAALSAGSLLSGLTSIIGGIGAIISAAEVAWKGLKKLFGMKDTWEKVMDEVRRDFGGAEISEGLAKEIEKTVKTVGDRSTAIMLHLSDILDEIGGVTTRNLDEWIGKTRDLFSFVETGRINLGQAAEQYDKIFPQLAKAIVDLKQPASETFLSLIDLAKRFGLESKAVTDFLREGNDRITKAITPVVGGTLSEIERRYESLKAKLIDIIPEKGDNEKVQRILDAKRLEATKSVNGQIVKDYQSSFDRISRITLGSITQMVANGATWADAIRANQGSIDQLREATDKFGFAGSAAYDKLSNWATLTEKFGPVLDQVSGLNDLALALQQTGSRDAGLFADIQAQANDAYKTLVDGGFQATEAQTQLLPLLRNILKMHEDQGLAIDENTQRLIDEARASGVLTDQQKTAADLQVDASNRIANAVEFLASKFGYVAPAAEAAAAGVEGAAGRMSGALEQTAGVTGQKTGEMGDFVAGFVDRSQGDFWRLHDGARDATDRISKNVALNASQQEIDVQNAARAMEGSYVGLKDAAAAQFESIKLAAGRQANDTVVNTKNANDEQARQWKVLRSGVGVQTGLIEGDIEGVITKIGDSRRAVDAQADVWRNWAFVAVGEIRRVGAELGALSGGGGISIGGFTNPMNAALAFSRPVDPRVVEASAARSGPGTVVNVQVDANMLDVLSLREIGTDVIGPAIREQLLRDGSEARKWNASLENQ